MQMGERIEKFFKEFMYEKGRNKNHHSGKNKIKLLEDLSHTLDEIEDYIDEKTKEYQMLKKK